MGVEIDQIEALVAIVRGGGFTRAATALHVSQPAVSRRLSLLERELGAPLFERLKNGVPPAVAVRLRSRRGRDHRHR